MNRSFKSSTIDEAKDSSKGCGGLVVQLSSNPEMPRNYVTASEENVEISVAS